MKIVRLSCVVMGIVWSTFEVARHSSLFHEKTFLDTTVRAEELYLGIHVVLLLVSAGLFMDVAINMIRRQWRPAAGILSRLLGSKEMFFLSAIVVAPSSLSGQQSMAREGDVSLLAVMKPALSVAMIRRLLERRRQEVANLMMPPRLTLSSATDVCRLSRTALAAIESGVEVAENQFDEVDELLDSLLVADTEVRQVSVGDSWDIVIRLYGFPLIENKNGMSAQFSKKRSIEVLAWLSMNRDRPRRSAVRTAVWDVDITDASFSTVMSDIRRGICDVATHRSREEVFPPTFSDHIAMGISMTTDVDLLWSALENFRKDARHARVLAAELSRIRDIPFAGANYMWADLDGTTTRMVVLAVQAAQELATWAQQQGDVELCMLAVKAGLRVLPGCDVLLEIQNSFISQRSMSRP